MSISPLFSASHPAKAVRFGQNDKDPAKTTGADTIDGAEQADDTFTATTARMDQDEPEQDGLLGGLVENLLNSIAKVAGFFTTLAEGAKSLMTTLIRIFNLDAVPEVHTERLVRQHQFDLGLGGHDGNPGIYDYEQEAPAGGAAKSDEPSREATRLTQRILMAGHYADFAASVTEAIQSPNNNMVLVGGKDPLALETAVQIASTMAREAAPEEVWFQADYQELLNNVLQQAPSHAGLEAMVTAIRLRANCPPGQPLTLVLKNLDDDDTQILLNQAYDLRNIDPDFKIVLSVDENQYNMGRNDGPPFGPGAPELSELAKPTGKINATSKGFMVPTVTNPEMWAQVLTADPDVITIQAQAGLLIDGPEATKLLVERLINAGATTYHDLLNALEALLKTVSEQPEHDASIPNVFPDATELTLQDVQNLSEKTITQAVRSVQTDAEALKLREGRVQLVNSQQIGETFDDLVGLEEAKTLFRQRIDELKYPDLYKHAYRNNPNAKQSAVLLHGPPGNGKTTLARATAKELAQAIGDAGTMIATTGPKLKSKYMNESAEMIRQLGQNINDAPGKFAVVFIDEIDALGKRIDAKQGAEQDNNTTINEFLDMMQGLDRLSKPVLFIFATNQKDNLDEAIKDRIQYNVEIENPTPEQRQAQLQRHLDRLDFASGFGEADWKRITAATDGFSGRNLENLMLNLQKERLGGLSDAEKAELNADAKKRAAYRIPLSADELLAAIRQFAKSSKGQDTGKPIGFQSGGQYL